MLSRASAYFNRPILVNLNLVTGLDCIQKVGEEHQIMKPNLISGMTAYDEFTKPGSQMEGMKTSQYRENPLIHVRGSSKLEWLPR